MANKEECISALKQAVLMLEKAYLSAPEYNEAKTFRAEIEDARFDVQSAINRTDDVF